MPTDRPYDFSKELFPLLLEMGRPLYGYVLEGYWQDIGNLDQYRQANFDALDGKVAARTSPASSCAATSGSARAWSSTTSTRSRGRRSSATTAGSRREASVGAVLGARRERRRCASARAIERSVIDAGTHIGRSAHRRGRDRRPRVRPPRARAPARGRRDRRRGDDRRRERDLPRRAHLPVQGGRVRRADPREPDLGVARAARASSAATASRGSSTST